MEETVMTEKSGSRAMNVVLVHGAWADGSGWEGVYRILTKDGYRVSVVQHPTVSLAEDVAATRRVLAAQDGPVVLVGHSYGGGGIPEGREKPHAGGMGLFLGWGVGGGQPRGLRVAAGGWARARRTGRGRGESRHELAPAGAGAATSSDVPRRRP